MDLTGKTLEEVRAIADSLKIKYHHKASADTIAAQINRQPDAKIADALNHPTQNIVNPVKFNTESEILDVIRPYLDKGLVASFDDEERTWLFKYNGREECGNMSVPLRVIKQKAENVSKGRLAPRGIKDGKDLILMA